MKHLTTFFLILLFPLTLFANEPQWKKFTHESTVLIAHVDLTNIDIAKTIQNNRPIVDTLLKALPGEPQDVRSLIAAGELGKQYLIRTLGIQEAYVVIDLQMVNTVPGMPIMILPQTGKINGETLRSAIALALPQDFIKVVNSRNNEFVLLYPTVDEPDRWLDRLLPPISVERSDFAEAFAAVEDAPIKIVAALPEFVRKVVRDTAPRLPAPAQELDIATLLTETRWTAIGIDPAKPAVHVTVATTSELAAAQVQRSFQEALAIFIKKGIEELEVLPENFSAKQSLLPTLKEREDRIRALLIPQPEGKNLVLHWEQPQFAEAVDIVMPIVAEETEQLHKNQHRNVCTNKMRSFLLACHNYLDCHGQLPPPFTVDANGKPLHSWRVLILPYMEHEALYQQIRLNEPWDSEHNKQFHDKMPIYFRCLASTLGNPNRDTVYCMVVGNETIGVPNGKGLLFSQITDGSSNTILLTERKTPVCWMEPVDILQEHAYLGVNQHEFGIGSEHPGGVTIGIADGSTRFMSENVSLKMLKAFLTKAGGETVNREDMRSFFGSVR